VARRKSNLNVPPQGAACAFQVKDSDGTRCGWRGFPVGKDPRAVSGLVRGSPPPFEFDLGEAKRECAGPRRVNRNGPAEIEIDAPPEKSLPL